MTIHKSKGLEFDIVVLPDLEKSLSRSTPLVVTDRKSPADPIHMVIRYTGEDVQSLLPEEYRRAFRLRVQKEVEESLSLLYVAITRAVHELVMIVEPLGKSARRKEESGSPTYTATFSGVLRAGLTVEGLPSGSPVLYENFGGDAKAFNRLIGRTPDAVQPKPQPELLNCTLAKKPAVPRRNLPRVTPSSLEATLVEIKTGSGRNRDDAMLWGTAMHACFEHGLRENPWLDQAVPDAESLAGIVRRAVLGQKGHVEPNQVVTAFLEACSRPTIRKTLSRSSYDAGLDIRVEHERRFAVRLEEGKILRGSVDRLVMLSENGHVTGLDVIDYKTDMPEDGANVEEFLAERREIYAPQLAAYRRGMSRLFGLDESRIMTKLLFVSLDRPVELI